MIRRNSSRWHLALPIIWVAQRLALFTILLPGAFLMPWHSMPPFEGGFAVDDAGVRGFGDVPDGEVILASVSRSEIGMKLITHQSCPITNQALLLGQRPHGDLEGDE